MPLEVADSDMLGVVFPLAREESLKIPIEVTSAARDTVGRVCLDTDAACGFWYLQLIKLQPNGYVEAVHSRPCLEEYSEEGPIVARM